MAADAGNLMPAAIHGGVVESIKKRIDIPTAVELGLCLLAGVYASPENKRNLYKISRFAVKRHLLFDHKYKKIITVDLSSCVRGVDYSIVKNRYGELELIEL